MSMKVFYDDDARKRVLAGAEILYNAVKTTMSPKGRNVVISNMHGLTVTHDGVTVAKNIMLPEVDDETLGYHVGAELIKKAANQMNEEAGDGTTTVTVLTYHILAEANKLVAAGHDPMELRKGLEKAATETIAKLTELSEEIKGKKRIAEVATISAGDAEIGNLIAEVIDQVGKNGVVTVEAGRGVELESEVVEGFTFDRGFVSAYMVTDQQRMEAVYNNPAIVVTDRTVNNIQEILPFIERIAQTGQKNLVLIAGDIAGEALGTLILNKLKGAFNTVAIKAPSFGDNQVEMLEDIATLTGATVISSGKEMDFTNATIEMVGTAQKVIVDRSETTIVEGAGKYVKERVAHIAGQLEKADNEYQKEQLGHRRAALESKVAVIRVGGQTETEIEEKKYRVDDAVAAVKAALSDGVVSGGGATLVYLASLLDSTDAGALLLRNALDQPFKILMENSGKNAERFIFDIRESKGLKGIDVTHKDILIDLKKAGIIDPTRVTREAIKNAVSIAGTAMTMGALVVEVPEQPQNGLQQ